MKEATSAVSPSSTNLALCENNTQALDRQSSSSGGSSAYPVENPTTSVEDTRSIPGREETPQRKSPVSDNDNSSFGRKISSSSNTPHLLSGAKRSSIVAHVPPFSRSIPSSQPNSNTESTEGQSSSISATEQPWKSEPREKSDPRPVGSSSNQNSAAIESEVSTTWKQNINSSGESFSASAVAVSGNPSSYLPSDAISVFHSLVSSAIDQCLRNSSPSKVRVSVFSSLFDNVSRSSTQSSSPALEGSEASNPQRMTSAQTGRRNGSLQNPTSPRWNPDKSDLSNDDYRSPVGSPSMLKIDEESSSFNGARDAHEREGEKVSNPNCSRNRAANNSDHLDDVNNVSSAAAAKSTSHKLLPSDDNKSRQSQLASEEATTEENNAAGITGPTTTKLAPLSTSPAHTARRDSTSQQQQHPHQQPHTQSSERAADSPEATSRDSLAQDLDPSSSSSSDMVNRLTKYLLEQHLFSSFPSNSGEKRESRDVDLNSDVKQSLMADAFGDKHQFASAVANAAVAALTSRQNFRGRDALSSLANTSTDAQFSGPFSTPSPKLIGTPPPLTKEEPLNLSAPSPCSLSPTEQKIKIVVANEVAGQATTAEASNAQTRSESPDVVLLDKNSDLKSRTGSEAARNAVSNRGSTLTSEDIIRGFLAGKKQPSVANGKFGNVLANLREISPPKTEVKSANGGSNSAESGLDVRDANAFTRLCHNLIHSEVLKLSASDCEHAIEKKINTSSVMAALTAPEVSKSKESHTAVMPNVTKDDSAAQDSKKAPSVPQTSRSLPNSPDTDLNPAVSKSGVPTNYEISDLTSELLNSLTAVCPSGKMSKSQIHSIVSACMFSSESFSALKLLCETLKERAGESIASPTNGFSAAKRKLVGMEAPSTLTSSPPAAKSARLGGPRESPNGTNGSPTKHQPGIPTHGTNSPIGKVGRPPGSHAYPDDPPRLLPYSHSDQQNQLAAAVASLAGSTPSAHDGAHHINPQRAAPGAGTGAMHGLSTHHSSHHHSPHNSAVAENVAAIHARLAASDYNRNPLMRHPSQHSPHTNSPHGAPPPGSSQHTAAAIAAAASHAHHNSYLNLQKSAVVAQAAAIMKSQQQQHGLGHVNPSSSGLHHGTSSGGSVHTSPPGATAGAPPTNPNLSAASLPPPHHHPSSHAAVADSMAAAAAAQYHHSAAAAEHLRLFPNYPGTSPHVPKLLQPPGGASASHLAASAAAAAAGGHRSPILAAAAAASSALNKVPPATGPPGAPQSAHFGGASASGAASHYPHVSMAGGNPAAHDLESQLHHSAAAAAALGRFGGPPPPPPHLSGAAAAGHAPPPPGAPPVAASNPAQPPTDPTAAAILAFHHESQRKAVAAINAAALQHHPTMPPSAAAAINAAAAHHYNQQRQQQAAQSGTGLGGPTLTAPHPSAAGGNNPSVVPNHHASSLASNHHAPFGLGATAAGHAVDGSGAGSNHSPISRQLRGGPVGDAVGGVPDPTSAGGAGSQPGASAGAAGSLHSKPNGSQCANCGGEAIYLCSGCRKIWYCSQDCQVKAWERHYVDCFGSQGR